MTTTNFTTSLGLALPTTGDLSGTWGDTVNDYISKYLDSAVAGALTVSTDVTLTKTTNAALGATSSQYAILIASGHAANITVTAPAISKVYLVINKSGSYTVKVRGAGPTTGITVPVSTAALVAWDGSDFVLIATTDINSLSNVLAETKGGTGQSSYAVGDLLYASTTTALSKLADVATGNALISGGVGVAPSYGKIGLATHVSGALPIANGGSGQTTAQAAMNAFAGATTSGQFLRGNGTNVVMSAIQAGDITSLNDGTTLSASGTVGATTLGFRGVPQNSQTSSYTLALADAGKHISITTGGVVIPANASVAFPTGTAVTIYNNSGSNQTISITSDTLRAAGTAATGSRTLGQYGLATVLKVNSTVWVISGTGLS